MGRERRRGKLTFGLGVGRLLEDISHNEPGIGVLLKLEATDMSELWYERRRRMGPTSVKDC